ncbi:MAG TPA: M20/M25/M40 family metallo-hydrolase [Bryobacteraceae bacterium]|nr:M20/M25/M40 family metallo-hydrolase [Bryobacteraceae bacterium]
MKSRTLIFLVIPCILAAQVKIDDAVYARIKDEEAQHSQAMHTLHMLTDRYGPRLTGSPNFENAANWVVKQMTEWGFQNAHLEPWDFGHPGWLNMRSAGYMVAPIHGDLTFRVLSWTPSTQGTVTASVVEVEVPHGPPAPPPAEGAPARAGAGPQFLQPTKAEFDAALEPLRSKVKGKIVLAGKAAVVPVNFNPPPLRRGEGDRGGRGGRGPARGGTPDPNRMTAAQVTEQFDQFLISAGAVMRVNDAAMDHGLIRAFQNRTYDLSKALPTVVMRNDDYGRIERLLADGEDVKLEFNIVNETYPKGTTSYNVVGEIPGTDKADEIVMLGGHLDSWHSATGATDNGIGSTMMLEAARLIKSLGLKPRRTIRVALWSGEEEGLLGSAAYVKQHFGTFEDPKPEYGKLDCYFNIDSGTGRVRGAGVFGPPEAADILTAMMAPFKDWSAGVANATTSRATGGTDSTNFNAAGLPGVGLQQDPIEYQSFTWHTQLDTYERIVPEDVKQAATEIASMVWTVANLDQMIPRFAKEQMPAATPTPGAR